MEEFLIDIGLHRLGSPLDLRQLLEPFSKWLDVQELTEGIRWFLSARVAAFICEYLVEVASGERVIEHPRILIRLPIQEGVYREFDPYAMAVGFATNRTISLKKFLDVLCAEL